MIYDADGKPIISELLRVANEVATRATTPILRQILAPLPSVIYGPDGRPVQRLVTITADPFTMPMVMR